jgi:hypothetical protein
VEAGGVLRPMGPEVARRGEQAMAACPELIVARRGGIEPPGADDRSRGGDFGEISRAAGQVGFIQVGSG